MEKYELDAKFNIAETCAASLSLDDLQALSDSQALSPLSGLGGRKLTYGNVHGSDELRTNISNLWPKISKEDILITPGAISANLNVLYALVGKGDHVICGSPFRAMRDPIPLEGHSSSEHRQDRPLPNVSTAL